MAVKSKDTFVKGAAILGAAGLICKIIGAFYRILLINILHTDGMAFYEMSYPIYSFLLVLSTAGLPTAISKLVSEKVAVDDYRAAHRTFQSAYKTLFCIGVVTMALMFLGAPVYANLYNLKEGVYSLRAIAPALFFVSIVAAYRGYFQGMQIMTPTALSQLVEQVGKLVVGFAFAAYFYKMGGERGPQLGAMGALLGVSISEFLAMVLLIVMYNIHKGEIHHNMREHRATKKESVKTTIYRLVMVALPVSIGASIMPIAGMVDGYIAMNFLPVAGFSGAEAQQLYGIYAGSITSIINMPAVISLSIGVSLVPAISSALAKKDTERARQTAGIGFKLAIIIGLPCAIGLFLLAEPILTLLYSRALTAYEMPIAVRLLRVMSVGVMVLTGVQIITSIIQGYGEFKVPVINLFLGSLINIAISWALVVRPYFNIAGVAIGTVCCYGFASFCNAVYMFSISKLKLKLGDFVFKPLIANALMGALVYFIFPLLRLFLTSNFSLLLTILIAVVFYVLLIVFFRIINSEDMEFMPGGKKLQNLMVKLGVWE